MAEESRSNDLQRKVELSWLMAFYGGMLTEKQREVLKLHCEEDMSLGEIAQESGISRQGVHEMLSRASARLLELEEKLGMAARFRRVEDGLIACRDALKGGRYEEAGHMIDALLASEEQECE
ncbi:MAG: sigma factor-like helix-turn-helix DNA-binding protein [bacterium]|nr:sigma factor-like helix-turn-helix DNA-binding protein [bacterium]